ncbi:MAG: type II toxin-antitoxin system PemK/MazF family toxin [Synechococcus sp.]|nr:type II toxin-antitoxin system PemK/MazF family toxin [Synechococcus sp.]
MISLSCSPESHAWIRDQETRPCVVISPDELNAHLRTFIVAPLIQHSPFATL